MDNIKVSICVAYYNRSEYVFDCVNSLLNQRYGSFEVIVVNDGSTDKRTAEILDSIEDERLKVIHQENTGFVGAIRAAINAAKGEYIAIQGAGDVSAPMRIAKQAQVLDSENEVGIVSCLFENVVFGGEKDGERKKRGYNNEKITPEDFLEGANPLGHGEVMFRRSLYDNVGGYRSFFRFSQDLDLWLLMIDHCKVKILQEYLYERRMFMKDGVSTDPQKQFLQKYLAEFARQCYRDRRKYGKDLVEQYGHHAGLFKYPNKQISNLIATRMIQEMNINNVQNASFYERFASSEPFTVKLLVARVLYYIAQTPFGKKLSSSFIALVKS